ncbi:MAG: L,D-transpeptidase family protein [Alphaproteobacteria bacterium]|nr:L,D-transpeptidase family protein [Alphaproteobacteria bacterium]
MKKLGFLLVLMLSVPAFAAVAEPKQDISAAKTASVNAIGEMETFRTKYEDTLVHIARKYKLGFVEMVAANPELDPWMPGSGSKVILPTKHLLPNGPRQGVVINLSEMRLYVYPKSGGEPTSYPIGIGRDGLATPIGSTTVVRKVDGPVWRPTERMRKEDPKLPAEVPPGIENPMGSHALYLGWPTYAIHGTNKPYAIGRRVSSGCIRMYPEDIVEVYKLVPNGSKVTVIDQPVKVQWLGNDLYMEAHPTQEHANMIEKNTGKPVYEVTEAETSRITKAAGKDAEALDWRAVRKALLERKGYPVKIGTRASGSVHQVSTAP